MDTNDEKNLINESCEEYDIEEYYDETADEKYFKKAKPASLFEKYMKSKNSFVYTCLIIAILLMFLFGPFFKVTEISSPSVLLWQALSSKTTPKTAPITPP